MSYTTLKELVAGLKFSSRVQASEGFSDPADFEEVVKQALDMHNSSYTASATECNVPKKEKLAVVLLSWAELCYIRASRVAGESNKGQQGFGSEKSTPYYKLINLADKLKERYSELCQNLRLSTFYGVGAVSVSEVTVEDFDAGGQIPNDLAIIPNPPILESNPSSVISGNGLLDLTWFTDREMSEFYNYIVFHMTGSESIKQDWNFNSATGTPRIHDSATEVFRTGKISLKTVRLENLSFASGTINRFLVAYVTKSGKYAYSNELVLTQP